MLDLIARVDGPRARDHVHGRSASTAEGHVREEPYATCRAPVLGRRRREGTRSAAAGFFEGDFDGDGVKDLLDLGNLEGPRVLSGHEDDKSSATPLDQADVDRPGESLIADAVVADLDGDGKADAVLWNEDGPVPDRPGGDADEAARAGASRRS